MCPRCKKRFKFFQLGKGPSGRSAYTRVNENVWANRSNLRPSKWPTRSSHTAKDITTPEGLAACQRGLVYHRKVLIQEYRNGHYQAKFKPLTPKDALRICNANRLKVLKKRSASKRTLQPNYPMKPEDEPEAKPMEDEEVDDRALPAEELASSPLSDATLLAMKKFATTQSDEYREGVTYWQNEFKKFRGPNKRTGSDGYEGAYKSRMKFYLSKPEYAWTRINTLTDYMNRNDKKKYHHEFTRERDDILQHLPWMQDALHNSSDNEPEN